MGWDWEEIHKIAVHRLCTPKLHATVLSYNCSSEISTELFEFQKETLQAHYK